MTATTQSKPAPPAVLTDAYHRDTGDVAAVLDVDPTLGLSTATAAARLDVSGPNELAEPVARPAWLRFADQFRSWLIGILAAAAVLAGIVGDLTDALVILLVLVINAGIGFVQERRAQRSLQALRQMLVPVARVRRGGVVQVVPARQLVPGDLVLLEAGDRVPADGRLTVAEAVQADEAALTGESRPVAKHTGTCEPAGLPVAEHTSMLFMNTVLTRGRAEMIVTGTGMSTQVGAIAEALRTGVEPPSPLQVQLDSLGRRLALLGGAAVAVYTVLALARGESIAELALRAVALAVAAVPEGLPAVLAVTLAVGVHRMARRGAIVKRLASVETLGAATVVCSDKTGTLTMNRMTARALWFAGHTWRLTADGYQRDDGDGPAPAGGMAQAVLPFVACNDARLTDGEPIGDPTETALLVLARTADVHVTVPRRTGEIPFDPAAKYMATFHPEPGGRIRVYVKGALDVLLPRCTHLTTGDGRHGPLTDDGRDRVETAARAMAAGGLRVLAAATTVVDSGDEAAALTGLTLVSIVGLADPPRPQARDAIALCRRAGVAVKMITGDHADTAAAIAAELGITGDIVTGADLDAMTQQQLTDRVDGIGVFARVAPHHKVTIVQALAGRGHVVAMTGDGVNDAAALKAAHIGVAMGVTGTDVAKEAAAMVLTDDDFATIVRAIGHGRAIYDNVITFVRFQLSTNIAAILTLLAAPLFGLAAPLTAVQLLWINIIMDGPPAMALGLDPARGDVMHRPPRPAGDRILSWRRLAGIARVGAVMAAGTLAMLAIAGRHTDAATAATMAFTTFVLFQLLNVFNARAGHKGVFSRDQLRNPILWATVGAVAAVQVTVVHLPFAQRIFDTTALSLTQWGICLAVAATVLVVEQLFHRISPPPAVTAKEGSAS
ncbi:cation-translocating P-type ATPase [Actinoplanes xinjiangensis]|uniref:cation-translocating P-type ATPase n=1 Tax=Actinoplanes xinjiangensis TaxID=512350 RepID=UPI003443734B